MPQHQQGNIPNVTQYFKQYRSHINATNLSSETATIVMYKVIIYT